jgi:nucleotide-binding universal stress UspA family protein
MSNPTTRHAGFGAPTVSDVEGQKTGHKGKAVKLVLIVEHVASHTDYSALHELANLFSPADVELSLIHITGDLRDGLPSEYEELEPLQRYIQEGSARYQDAKTTVGQHLQRAGFTIRQEHTFPLVSTSMEPILHFIRESGQELLILHSGNISHANLGRNHFFLDLTTHSPISTLVLRRHFQHRGASLKTLFGIDISDASLNAAQKLHRYLQPQQTDLTLATVQSPVYQENAVISPLINQEIFTEALRANADLVFKMVGEILEIEGFQLKGKKVLMGSPATELGYIAEQENPDLVVVGSHNHKGFLAWVMGSVSSQLLHWDTHNLLVIR